MILRFIDINKKIILILLASISALYSSYVFSLNNSKFVLSDKSGVIYSRCNKDLCNIYLKKVDGSKITLLNNTLSPTIDELSGELVRLYFTCGSPCNYTNFYEQKKGISQSFEFVVAVDVNREIVVIAEENQLVGYKIFDKKKNPLFNIQRNWSPTATLYGGIIEAKFNGNIFEIKYLEGQSFKAKSELIPIQI